MKDSIKNLLPVRGMKLLHIVITTLIFAFFWRGFYLSQIDSPVINIGQYPISFLYMVLLLVLNRIYSSYAVGMSRVSEIILSLSLANFVAAVLFYNFISIVRMSFPSPLPLLALIFVQVLFNSIWSVKMNAFYFKLYKPKPTAVIYSEDDDLRKLLSIRYFSSKFRMEKRIKKPENIQQIINEVTGCEVIFVVGISASLRNGIAKYCVENSIEGYIQPEVGDVIMAGAKHIQKFCMPIFHVHKAAPLPEYLFVKRLLDLLFSSLALIALSPLMLIIALAVKLGDGGPVLFKQVRLTKNGKEFNILKFRSMRVDAESEGPCRSTQHDCRITAVGKRIRAARLDELPQLFNILKGDMTIVGPRPERIENVMEYTKVLPAFSLRLQVKAGLTGYSQIYGRYNTEPIDKLEMDLMYINNMSVMEDLKLMVATLKILFMKESSEGFPERQKMAAEPSEQVENK